mmetsp:Transcript_13057/g.24529  ORF Transcript_13057/g.24529 Transcript_13057/m.24529 type:complete len:162 (+) Transcript_13057:70-555(+)
MTSTSFNIQQQQQRILGIALVVEEVGKFSKLVFRYPPSPSCTLYSASPNHDETNDYYNGKEKEINEQASTFGTPGTSGSGENKETLKKDNIFYTLPAEVMAKLFRTKPALCGQPMTLSIGGTIFCCRSVLLNQYQSTEDNSTVVSSSQTGTGINPTASDSW